MKVGYARVSTNNQNPDLQIDGSDKQVVRRFFKKRSVAPKLTAPF
jgi:DNA invertase Pin-like site-specific DNA recombinase